MTSSQRQWLHRSVGESVVLVSRGHGFKPRWSPAFFRQLCNRPFPSSPQPPFQREAKCEFFVMKISFHSYWNWSETNYHNKNFALRLALKERLRRTRKWPIAIAFITAKIIAYLRTNVCRSISDSDVNLWQNADTRNFKTPTSDLWPPLTGPQLDLWKTPRCLGQRTCCQPLLVFSVQRLSSHFYKNSILIYKNSQHNF